MKELSMFPSLMFSTICAFVVMTCVVSAQLPATLKDGLVSYYSFDGNANDVAGTNSGTAMGVALTNGVTGKQNTAYYFSGLNSYVTAPYTPTPNNAFTWNVWIKPQSVTKEQFVLSSVFALGANEVSPALLISHTNTGNPFSELAAFYSWHPEQGPEYLPTTNSLNVNEWTMLTITSDTNNHRSFFVNGALNSTSSTSGYGQQFEVLLFGADRMGSLNYEGTMDDISIHNRPLTATEVSSLYLLQSDPAGDADNDGVTNFREVSDETNPNDASSFNPLSKGLVAYYPLDGNANDESGNNNNGNPASVEFTNSRAGLPAAAGDFRNNGYVEIPGLQSLKNFPITYSAWCRLDTYQNELSSPWGSGIMTVVGKEQDNTPGVGSISLFNWRIADPISIDKLSYVTFSSVGGTYTGAYSTTYTPDLARWFHVVFTYDEAGKATFYANGSKISEQLLQTAEFTDLPVTIGSSLPATYTGSAIRKSWQGSIDDVRIYNRALSLNEVEQLYKTEVGSLDSDGDGANDYRELEDGTDQQDPNSFNPLSVGLAAYYPFNGNADDDSGFENNGSVFGAELAADRFSQPASAYMFERANLDRIEVPWSVDTAQGVTCLSFWLLDTSPDGGTGFILSGEAEYDWSVHIAATNKVRFLPSPPVGGGGTAIDSTEAFVHGEWNHILCMSGTTSDDRGIWINGRKVASNVSDGSDTEPSAHVSSKLWIGGRQIWPSNQDHYFNGLVDDVRIYNRPLGKNEIQQLFYSESFNASQRQFLASAPAVMGHYSQTDYQAFGALQLSNGVSSVLTNPSAFNLFPQSEYENFGSLQFSNGVSSVITNPSAFNLFTQSEYEGFGALQFNNGVSAGIGIILSNPASYSLYTSDSIMDLRMGGLMIRRQGTNAVVSFQPQTTTDLTQPFTNNGAPISHTIPMPGNKGFLRINAKP